MATLPPLPSLPGFSDLTDTATKAGAAAASAVDAVQNVGNFLDTKTSSIVMIVLGLLLIAAGIFSFDKTRELIVKGGKAAGAVAAAA